jgi:hypothetical protein
MVLSVAAQGGVELLGSGAKLKCTGEGVPLGGTALTSCFSDMIFLPYPLLP